MPSTFTWYFVPFIQILVSDMSLLGIPNSFIMLYTTSMYAIVCFSRVHNHNITNKILHIIIRILPILTARLGIKGLKYSGVFENQDSNEATTSPIIGK